MRANYRPLLAQKVYFLSEAQQLNTRIKKEIGQRPL